MVGKIMQPIQQYAPQQETPLPRTTQPTLIEPQDIKAILYMGLRGDIALPVESQKVDILA